MGDGADEVERMNDATEDAGEVECATCGQPCHIGGGDGGTTCFYLPVGGPGDGAFACVTCGGKISNAPIVPMEMKP